MYRFIHAHATQYAVETMCRVMGISRSAYYDYWQTAGNREADEKKKEVEAHIVSIFKEHRSRYGVRRMVAEMQATGMQVGAYQVGKVLQQKGLKAIQPRSLVPKTTDSRSPYPISPNVLHR